MLPAAGVDASAATATAVDTYLYFWDDRDGPQFQGWWITPGYVGNDAFLAFSPGSAQTPDQCSTWRGGAELLDVCVASLASETMGVRAAGKGFEGAFEVDEVLTRQHGPSSARSIFKRSRDLSDVEVDAIDRMRGGTIVYSASTSLAAAAALSGSAASPVVGVPLGGPLPTSTQAVLQWVQGGAEEEEEEEEEEEAPPTTRVEPAAVPGAPRLRLSLRIETAADLDAELTKGAHEQVSLPALADDDESPLPVGWVVAERSHRSVTGSVRSFLLTAARHLEEELPEQYRALPAVVQLAAQLRKMVDERGFQVCVWSER